MKVINECVDLGLIAGIVTGFDVSNFKSSQEQTDELRMLVKEFQTGREFDPEIQKAVRDMLRKGGFRPAGRSKPASEYLSRSACEDNFPFINNLVDINNYLSLLSGIPMSLLDLDVTGRELFLRQGLPGESYIFNKSGQEMDLKGLICTCSAVEPLGNPVKDSMKAKVTDQTKNVVAVIYTPSPIFDKIRTESLARRFAQMLSAYAGAVTVSVQVV